MTRILTTFLAGALRREAARAVEGLRGLAGATLERVGIPTVTAVILIAALAWFTGTPGGF